jgi:murein DD-endopeptidase MepM/ murein hydrolase activator NlpD
VRPFSPASAPRVSGVLPPPRSVRLLARLVVLLLLPVLPAVLGRAPVARADGASPAAGVWPLDPRPEVVARFDPPDSRWGAGHRGVDLLGHVAERVRAAASGRVAFAGTLAGRGVVVVDHGGTRTTYEPVDAVVRVGDAVRAGAVLGRLQLFGSHCFPRACLHWGLIEGAEHYLDPLTLVGAGPVRLLPLGGPLGGRSDGPSDGPWPTRALAATPVTPIAGRGWAPTPSGPHRPWSGAAGWRAPF